MKKLIFKISLTLFLLPIVVGAQGWQRIESKYLFHLLYDNGKLSIDRSYEYPYDIIPEPAGESTKLFRAEVVNFLDQVASTVYFDPTHGDPNFKKGNIFIEIPYVADGKVVNFYNPQDIKLLTISVAETSFCDDDSICDTEFGEDDKNCANDCKPALLASPSESPEPGLAGGAKNNLIWIILGAGVLLAVIIYVYRWVKLKRRGPFPSSSDDKQPPGISAIK